MTERAMRAEIKAAGGAVYEALLVKEREARALFRRRHPDEVRQERRGRRKSLKAQICMRARRRARQRGLGATIKPSDLHWPTHCPVLGIELDYTPNGQGRRANNPSNPTLDRWDNTKGYVVGNVFVISMRANNLKNDATWAELEAVMRYARDGLNFLRVVA